MEFKKNLNGFLEKFKIYLGKNVNCIRVFKVLIRYKC